MYQPFRRLRNHWYTTALTFPELPETLVQWKNGQNRLFFQAKQGFLTGIAFFRSSYRHKLVFSCRIQPENLDGRLLCCSTRSREPGFRLTPEWRFIRISLSRTDTILCDLRASAV